MAAPAGAQNIYTGGKTGAYFGTLCPGLLDGLRNEGFTPTCTESAGSLDNIQKLLADPTRMRIVIRLQEGESSVTGIALALGMEQSAVSHQLSKLLQGGLVTNRRDGKQIHYRIADHHVKRILVAALEHAGEG